MGTGMRLALLWGWPLVGKAPPQDGQAEGACTWVAGATRAHAAADPMSQKAAASMGMKACADLKWGKPVVGHALPQDFLAHGSKLGKSSTAADFQAAVMRCVWETDV